MKLIDNTGLSYLISKIKTMIGLKADKTYVDNKVKTDVPSNAKFTDTIVDISGKQDKLTAGDNITITNNTISATDAGSIVDLGSFDTQVELITHVVMNQLPTGHYTFIVEDTPCLMLLERTQSSYVGSFRDSIASFYYFRISFYGELLELKTIKLRDAMTDVSP